MAQTSMGWCVSAATRNAYRFGDIGKAEIDWLFRAILFLVANNLKRAVLLASQFVFRVKLYFGVLKSI